MIDADVLRRVQATLVERKGAPAGSSYVASLYEKGTDAICKKVAEEGAETLMAAKDGDAQRIIAETADLWFHCLVMLAQHHLRPEQVLAELQRRAGTSGIEEKAARKADARERTEP